MSENYAAKIKEARKNAGMTQKQLAEKSELSLMSIRRYENGERVPKSNDIVKIAKALEVNTIELLPKEFKEAVDKITSSRLGVEFYQLEERWKKFADHLAIDLWKELVEVFDGATDDEISQILYFGKVYRSVSDKKPKGFQIIFADENEGDTD